MYRSGEVVLLPFPFSDRGASKRRPVVVLTDQDSVGDLVCVAVTSSTIDIGDRVELTRSDFARGTLPRRSWVRTSKIYTVNSAVTLGRFGRLSESALGRVRAAVCGSLGC